MLLLLFYKSDDYESIRLIEKKNPCLFDLILNNHYLFFLQFINMNLRKYKSLTYLISNRIEFIHSITYTSDLNVLCIYLYNV